MFAKPPRKFFTKECKAAEVKVEEGEARGRVCRLGVCAHVMDLEEGSLVRWVRALRFKVRLAGQAGSGGEGARRVVIRSADDRVGGDV